MILKAGGRKCNCGLSGCAEQYVSGSATAQNYNDIMRFVMGGGVLNAGDQLLQRIKQEVMKYSLNIMVVPAELGNEASLVGAVRLAYATAWPLINI